MADDRENQEERPEEGLERALDADEGLPKTGPFSAGSDDDAQDHNEIDVIDLGDEEDWGDVSEFGEWGQDLYAEEVSLDDLDEELMDPIQESTLRSPRESSAPYAQTPSLLGRRDSDETVEELERNVTGRQYGKWTERLTFGLIGAILFTIGYSAIRGIGNKDEQKQKTPNKLEQTLGSASDPDPITATGKAYQRMLGLRDSRTDVATVVYDTNGDITDGFEEGFRIRNPGASFNHKTFDPKTLERRAKADWIHVVRPGLAEADQLYLVPGNERDITPEEQAKWTALYKLSESTKE